MFSPTRSILVVHCCGHMLSVFNINYTSWSTILTIPILGATFFRFVDLHGLQYLLLSKLDLIEVSVNWCIQWFQLRNPALLVTSDWCPHFFSQLTRICLLDWINLLSCHRHRWCKPLQRVVWGQQIIVKLTGKQNKLDKNKLEVKMRCRELGDKRIPF